jgi:hypothetical protein
MSESMRAAKLVAESVGALLDAAQHVARCGSLEHADADYLLGCSRRVYSAFAAADDVSAVEELGDLANDNVGPV